MCSWVTEVLCNRMQQRGRRSGGRVAAAGSHAPHMRVAAGEGLCRPCGHSGMGAWVCVPNGRGAGAQPQRQRPQQQLHSGLRTAARAGCGRAQVPRPALASKRAPVGARALGPLSFSLGHHTTPFLPVSYLTLRPVKLPRLPPPVLWSRRRWPWRRDTSSWWVWMWVWVRGGRGHGCGGWGEGRRGRGREWSGCADEADWQVPLRQVRQARLLLDEVGEGGWGRVGRGKGRGRAVR